MTVTAPAAAPLSHPRALAMMSASTACFAANVLIVRALGNDPANNSWLIVAARFATGLALIFAIYPREFAPRRLVESRALILRGVIGSLATWAFYLTVQKIGAGRATFIGNTYIVWAALMAAVVLREKLSGPMLAGALVALGGLALMTDLPGSGAHASGYDLMAILNALASAWVVVLVRQMHATEHTATIFGSQCVYGLLLCAAPAVWHFSTPSPASAALIVLAGLAAGAGQLLMTHAYRALSVAEGSLIQALLPIGIALGGAVIFGERFRGAEIVGATLILAGTLVPTLKAGWPRRRSEPYPLAADIRRHCRARDHLGRE